MKRITSGQKWAIAVLVAIVLVIAVLKAAEARVNARDQYADENAFLCYSLSMQAEADPAVLSSSPGPLWSFWPTFFLQVEYVEEFPIEEKRQWAVIYIKPDGSATQARIDLFNEIIVNDPSIKIDKRLALPLTVDQVISYPDAVLEIIKQLDNDQWNVFYPMEADMRISADVLARNAGIEVPGGIKPPSGRR